MWQESAVWPGSKYTFKFGNGTTHHAETKAVPAKSTEKINFNFANGKALFNALCAPEKQSSSSAKPSSSATPSSSSALQSATPTPSSGLPVKAAPTELPKPVVREPENLISGYYLHEKGLEDVAVLLVPTFTVKPGPQYISFSTYAAKFIKQAAADGKRRLVVDVTGNPGGVVNAGYDLFKQLFPNKPIYSAGRFRAHEAMDFVGQALATLETESDLSLINGLAVGAAVTPNQTYNFQSWAEEYGPYEQLGTNVSSLFASNFSIVSTAKTPIHGYIDSKVKQAEPPFKPDNILLVSLHRPYYHATLPLLTDPGYGRILRINLHHLQREHEMARRQEPRLRWPTPKRSHASYWWCQRRPSGRIDHFQHIPKISYSPPARIDQRP